MQKLLFPLLLSGLTACQSAADEPTTATAPTRRPARPAAPHSAPGSPAQVATRFFAWYRSRPDSLKQDLLAYNPNDHRPDDQPLDSSLTYAVSPAKHRAYLAGLRSTHCVSAFYVNRLDRHIRKWGHKLEVSPQYDGIVEGFHEGDWILESQDGDPWLDQIEQAAKQVRYPTPGRAVVTVSYARCPQPYPEKVFYLRHYPAGWLIDSIATL